MPSAPRPLGRRERLALTSEGWLAEQNPAFQNAFLSLGHVRGFEAGERLYLRNRPVARVYGLIDGQIDVHLRAPNNEDHVFPSAGRSKWYSFADAVTGDLAAGSAIVSRPSSLYCVSRSEFMRFLDGEPSRYRAVISHDNTLRRNLQATLVNVISGSGEARVAQRLLGLLSAGSMDANEGLTITQQQFAAALGVSAPTVQRGLRRLRNAGLVETRYGRIRVLDVEGLSKHVETSTADRSRRDVRLA